MKFLKTQMTPSDLMAIMTFSSDLKVVEDFTDDRDELTKDIKKLTIGRRPGLRRDGHQRRQRGGHRRGVHRRTTPSSTSSIPTASWPRWKPPSRCWARCPRRRRWSISPAACTRNGLDNQAQLRATINAAIRANVSFYPDRRARPGGVGAAGRRHQGVARRPGHVLRQFGAGGATSNFQGQQETLYTLAADTGGKALLDNNDLSAGHRAGAEGHFQLLHPRLLQHQHQPGRPLPPHQDLKIKQRPRRPSSITATGYFAGKEFSKFNSTDKERQLAEALMLGDPITDIDVAMEMDYFRLARDRYFVPVAVKIPGSELELAQARRRRKHPASTSSAR